MSSSPEQTQAGVPNPDAILRAIYSWLPSYTTAYPFPTYPQVPIPVPVPVQQTNGPKVLDTAILPQAFPSTFPAFGPTFVPDVNTSITRTSSEGSSVWCANPLDIFGATSQITMQKSLSSSLPNTNALAGIIPTMPLKTVDLRRTSSPASLNPSLMAPRPPLHELPITIQNHSGKVIPRQRTRIANACNRCRICKARCFGSDPCHRCSKRGLICEFVPHKKSTSEEEQTSGQSRRKRRAVAQAASLSDAEQSPELDLSLPLARSQSDDQGYNQLAPAPAPVPVPTQVTPDSTTSWSALHTPAATHPTPSSALGLELYTTENPVESSPSSGSIGPTISIETPSSSAYPSTGFDTSLLPTFDWAPAATVTPSVPALSHDLSFYSSIMEDHMLPFTLLSSFQPNQAQGYDHSLIQSQSQPQIVDLNEKVGTPHFDETMFPFQADWLKYHNDTPNQLYGSGLA